MTLAPYTLPSGFVLPSIHSVPPFFTQQPNPNSRKIATDNWTRLLLSYARHKKLFVLRAEDVDVPNSEWEEVLSNPRIGRKIRAAHLAAILAHMVTSGQAVYDPPNQTSAVLLYWRSPEEWAQVLHDWASSTGQLNTIMTFYEIVEPPVPSPLSGLPFPILRKVITILTKSNRAQIIAVADGEGVRFLSGQPGR
ncbi:ESCRT-II complex vps25 subunit [Dichomitus squalens]|uniref:ESCRT-II complex vps25 subunit n=1 Tax=Dichomitus squalens TaxID=114155 RepID=A0A4Q9N4N7_9APHY|nr:ESCRT-II complex vps25 subunit [Dichomitus squalens]